MRTDPTFLKIGDESLKADLLQHIVNGGGGGGGGVVEGGDFMRESGTGILEFSPEKAGLDVTPANFEFPHQNGDPAKRHSGTFSTIAGNYLFIY